MFLDIHGFDQARETVLRQKGIRRCNGRAFYNRGALEQKKIRVIIDQNGNFNSFQFSQVHRGHFFLLWFIFEKRLGFFWKCQQKFKDGVIEIVGLLNQKLVTAPFNHSEPRMGDPLRKDL
jgi:hypothetical protein